MVPSRDRKDGVEAEERTTRRSAVAAEGMSRGSNEIPIKVSAISSTTSRNRCRSEECIDVFQLGFLMHIALANMSVAGVLLILMPDWGR